MGLDVNFKMAKSFPEGLCRILGGLILYAALNFLLKTLLNPALTPWPGRAEYLFRTIRYCLCWEFIPCVLRN